MENDQPNAKNPDRMVKKRVAINEKVAALTKAGHHCMVMCSEGSTDETVVYWCQEEPCKGE